MKAMKQYVMTVYADGTIRLTQRALPKRGWHGQFTGNRRRPVVISQAICPNCGCEIGLVGLG